MADYPEWKGRLKMGTRKPGHNHGFEDGCTTDCDGFSKPDPRGFGFPSLGRAARALSIDTSALEAAVEIQKYDFPIKPATEEARVIVEVVLPRLMRKFLHKNAQYARAQTGHDLGIKGIIPDINRKSAALITAVWDGGTIEGGDTDEAVDIAEDLVGHLLLMLAKMEDMPEWQLAPGRLLPKDA